MKALGQRMASWEQILVLAATAVLGVYAGVAAGLFASCIRFAQIALFRAPELWGDLGSDPWRERFLSGLASAAWHPEFALIAVLALLASLELPALARRRKLPLFEADRLRSVGLAGAFGLTLYYPLLVLRTFNATFQESSGGLFSMLLAAPWWVRVLAPALGALAAGAIVRYVSPESGGHGVLEVIEAVHTRKELRGRVAFWKSVAAGLTIGSGGSAGREGPVVHLGGAVAAAIARYLRLPRERVSLLLAAGAGAGIAASFQAPLAGAMFAVEIVLGGDYSVRGFAPIVLACVTASVTARSLLGDPTDLNAVGWTQGSAWEIALYVVLGLLSGAVAFAYIRANDLVHTASDRFLRRLPRAARPAIGGLLVGLIGLVAPRALGTGLESMNAALAGQLALSVLAVALVAKLAATSLTLGTGAPGGSFFPAVFCGAMLGGTFAKLAQMFAPALVGSPGTYVAVAMGAVVAGSTAAPLTGTLMMFELTGSHPIVLPLLLASGIAAAQVHAWLGGSLYTLALRKKGVAVSARDKVLRDLSVEEALDRVEPVSERLPWRELMHLVAASDWAALPVAAEDGRITGLISVRDVRNAMLDPALADVTVAADLARRDPVRVAVDDDLESALRRLTASATDEALVIAADGGATLGVITRERVLEAWRRATE